MKKIVVTKRLYEYHFSIENCGIGRCVRLECAMCE